MKYQVTRNGQYIGAPKSDRTEAQQGIVDDMASIKKSYEDGWITEKQYKAFRWNIIRVR